MLGIGAAQSFGSLTTAPKKIAMTQNNNDLLKKEKVQTKTTSPYDVSQAEINAQMAALTKSQSYSNSAETTGTLAFGGAETAGTMASAGSSAGSSSGSSGSSSACAVA